MQKDEFETKYREAVAVAMKTYLEDCISDAPDRNDYVFVAEMGHDEKYGDGLMFRSEWKNLSYGEPDSPEWYRAHTKDIISGQFIRGPAGYDELKEVYKIVPDEFVTPDELSKAYANQYGPKFMTPDEAWEAYASMEREGQMQKAYEAMKNDGAFGVKEVIERER